MMYLGHEGHAPIKAWVEGVPIEASAMAQLLNCAKLPFIYKHLAVMPDVHWGMGATVGSVIPTYGAIVPAAVGVDIGCGMIWQRTNLRAEHLPDSLAALRAAIEKAIPHGRTNNGRVGDRGAWGNPPEAVKRVWEVLTDDYGLLVAKHPKLAAQNTIAHLGTLGTGNHFVEVVIDEEGFVGIMLHSGSRGVGNRIGSYFIERAKEHMRRWFVNLPDENLAYLPESCEDFSDYWKALSWAQTFARLNRELMMAAALTALDVATGLKFTKTEAAVNCHHNYVAREAHFGRNVWVTRKGAVRAGENDLGIIPGSMGARSYIVRGKGNVDSFSSCSHGAGRCMSRGEAKRTFTVEDHERATAGVECRKDADVLDETPGAYKDIDVVMAAQRDLVDVVHTLKQVVCVKG